MQRTCFMTRNLSLSHWGPSRREIEECVESLQYPKDRCNAHICTTYVIKLAGGLLFFLPFPYLVAVFSLLYTTLLYLGEVFSLLYITLHYWGHYSLLYSTCVRFMVAGGDLFVTPPLWHPASVAVRTLS